MRRCLCVMIASVMVIATTTSPADMITIQATDVGSYYAGLGSYPTDSTYVAGIVSFPNSQGQVKDFFVFDLSSVTGYVTAATLTIFDPAGSYNSPNTFDVFEVSGVSVPVDDLVGRTANYFNKLGLDYGNVDYGGVVVKGADNGSFLTFNLTPGALTSLTIGEGGLFAIGGEDRSLNQVWLGNRLSDDAIFVGGSDASLVSLTLTTSDTPPSPSLSVPEPSSLALMSLSLVGLMLGWAGRLLCS